MSTDRMSAATAIALGLLALACAGCGQKGALYLPDSPPQAVPGTAPAPAPATAPATAPTSTPTPGAVAPEGKPRKPAGG